MNKSTVELQNSIKVWQDKLEYCKLYHKFETFSARVLLKEIKRWGVMTPVIESLLIRVLSLKIKPVPAKTNIYDGSSRHKMKSEYHNIIVKIVNSPGFDDSQLFKFVPDHIRYPFNVHEFGDLDYLLYSIGISHDVLHWRRTLQNYLFTGKSKKSKSKINKRFLKHERRIEKLEDSYVSSGKDRVKNKIECALGAFSV